jgi:hydrogenase nickel incorporation protein HypA/HybF
MHEMSLAEGIIQLLEDQASKQSFTRVKQVWLEIGLLASVDVDSLLFSLDIVSRDTLADGAAIHLSQPAGQGWCLQCSQSVMLENSYQGCPRCGSFQIQVTAGDSMRVIELQVE